MSNRDSYPKSDFVHVNGIRLHYLDWGGEGPTLIFLTGMGCSSGVCTGASVSGIHQHRTLPDRTAHPEARPRVRMERK